MTLEDEAFDVFQREFPPDKQILLAVLSAFKCEGLKYYFVKDWTVQSSPDATEGLYAWFTPDSAEFPGHVDISANNPELVTQAISAIIQHTAKIIMFEGAGPRIRVFPAETVEGFALRKLDEKVELSAIETALWGNLWGLTEIPKCVTDWMDVIIRRQAMRGV